MQAPESLVPSMSTPVRAWRRPLATGLLSLGLGWLVTQLPFGGLPGRAHEFLGLLTFTVSLWALEVTPPGIAGMLFMILAILLKLTPPTVAFNGFVQPTLWLIVASLVLGGAAAESGLGRRLATWILWRVRANRPARLLVAFLSMGTVLTLMIPTVFGRLAILLPIALGLAQTLNIPKGSRYGKFLMLAAYFGSQGPFLVFMTGYEATLVAIADLAKRGFHVYWSQYLVMWLLPGMVLTLGLYYGVAMLLFRPRPGETGERLPGEDQLRDDWRRLGPLSVQERNILIVYALVVLLWALDFWTHIAPAYIAVLGMIALYLPGVSGLGIESFRRINLLNIIFFASALSIGPMLTYLHVTGWFGQLLRTLVPAQHLNYGSALALSGLVALVHLGNTVTGTMATATPIFLAYAQAQHLNPILLAWLVVGANQVAFFPYQREPMLMVYNEGYWTIWDIIKTGIVYSVPVLLLVPLFVVTWWPWLLRLLGLGH